MDEKEEKKSLEKKPSLSRTSSTTIKKKEKKKRAKSKQRKRKASVAEINFDIPGVKRITLPEETQQFMQCVVGENVTAEKPWKSIKKDMFEDHLDLHEESSEFLPLKDDILIYPRQEILMGYVPDETRDYDEFYICLTEAAQDAITEIIEKIREEQEERLKNSIFKTIRRWKSLGSAPEVEQEISRKTRELIQVEVESDYPIMYPKVHFKLRRAEDVRDGYMEILSTRQKFQNVVKRRIDGHAQASPTVKSSEAQTVCPYPSNAYTQYEYNVDTSLMNDKSVKVPITEEMQELIDSIFDILVVNGNIDLYSDDYSTLINKDKKTEVPEDSYMTEYMSFTDISFCKNKMITCVAWHPMWSGTLAISYGIEAATTFLKSAPQRDETHDAVHGINPVLLWSFVDGLNAKLLLEAHREVRKLSFCPYDENILVGGCINGQVIVWDIKNKLKYVEEEEVLTIEQAKYRALMQSLMTWMKNIHDLKVIRSTALSDLEHSHRASITAIQWMPPTWEISKTGKLVDIKERPENTSLQFITSSEDGTLMFWDLRSRPTLKAGGFRPQRKLRRLKKKPDTLTVDVSPYKSLNRVFVPTYKINVTLPNEGDRFLSLSYVYCPVPAIKYEEAEPNPKRKFNVTDRIIYQRKESTEEFVMEPLLYASTEEGDVIAGRWEGFDFNSGEVVNSENLQIFMRKKYHDGPVLNIKVGALKDIMLSVGGNTFALWKQSYPDRPILWRRSRQKFTHGQWNKFRRSMFCLTRADGNLEVWQMLNQSHIFGSEQTISGQTITSATFHPLKMKQNILGISDYNGSYRLFYIPHSLQKDSDEEIKQLGIYFDREVERKKAFVQWQNRWREKHREWIEETERNVIQQQKQKEEDARIEKKRRDDEKIRQEIELIRMQERALKPPAGLYKEWATERFERREEEHLLRALLNSKHLNKELLEKEHAPVKKYEDEKLRKKMKQDEVLRSSERNFHEKVSILFPDALKKRVLPPEDPYKGHVSEEDKERIQTTYLSIADEMRDYVEEHPFVYRFDWREIINAGRLRRKMLDNKDHRLHSVRHEEFKFDRQANLDMISMAEAEAADRRPRRVRRVSGEEGDEWVEVDDEEDEIMFDDDDIPFDIEAVGETGAAMEMKPAVKSETALKATASVKSDTALKGAPSVKSATALKGAPSVKSATALKGAPSVKSATVLKGAPSVKSATALKAAASVKSATAVDKGRALKADAAQKAEAALKAEEAQKEETVVEKEAAVKAEAVVETEAPTAATEAPVTEAPAPEAPAAEAPAAEAPAAEAPVAEAPAAEATAAEATAETEAAPDAEPVT